MTALGFLHTNIIDTHHVPSVSTTTVPHTSSFSHRSSTVTRFPLELAA